VLLAGYRALLWYLVDNFFLDKGFWWYNRNEEKKLPTIFYGPELDSARKT